MLQGVSPNCHTEVCEKVLQGVRDMSLLMSASRCYTRAPYVPLGSMHSIRWHVAGCIRHVASHALDVFHHLPAASHAPPKGSER